MKCKYITFIGIVAITIALLGLILFAANSYRAKAAPAHPLLPVAFDHADHRTTQCAKCHHNFTDNTGGGTCYQCHKLSPDISFQMEEMFHEFCEGCHVETRMKGEDSGPLRECAGCHHE